MALWVGFLTCRGASGAGTTCCCGSAGTQAAPWCAWRPTPAPHCCTPTPSWRRCAAREGLLECVAFRIQHLSTVSIAEYRALGWDDQEPLQAGVTSACERGRGCTCAWVVEEVEQRELRYPVVRGVAWETSVWQMGAGTSNRSSAPQCIPYIQWRSLRIYASFAASPSAAASAAVTAAVPSGLMSTLSCSPSRLICTLTRVVSDSLQTPRNLHMHAACPLPLACQSNWDPNAPSPPQAP